MKGRRVMTKQKMAQTEELFDVAIVGGGIAGLYCCYHLQKKANRLRRGTQKIALLEASNRLGGRIETWRVDPEKLANRQVGDSGETVKIAELIAQNERLKKKAKSQAISRHEQLRDIFVAEFGPMRIEPDQQPHLKRLLTEMGICEPADGQQKWSDLVAFPSYQADQPTEPRFNLEGEEAEQTTLIDLLLLALRRIFEVVSIPDGDNDKPWRLQKWGSAPGKARSKGDSVEYKEANFFWKELRKEYDAPQKLDT